jgi:hypothetical protein
MCGSYHEAWRRWCDIALLVTRSVIYLEFKAHLTSMATIPSGLHLVGLSFVFNRTMTQHTSRAIWPRRIVMECCNKCSAYVGTRCVQTIDWYYIHIYLFWAFTFATIHMLGLSKTICWAYEYEILSTLYIIQQLLTYSTCCLMSARAASSSLLRAWQSAERCSRCLLL